MALLSSPKGLKVVKRGRSSSMGFPCPREKKAQGREPLAACRVWGLPDSPHRPWVSITSTLGLPKLGLITLFLPGETTLHLHDGERDISGPRRRKALGGSDAGREELRRKHLSPPAPLKPPACQVSPGEGREKLSSS